MKHRFVSRCRLNWWVLCLSLALWLPAAAQTDTRGPEAAQDTPVRFASGPLAGMTVTPTTVYWHTNCGGDFYPARSFLRRKPVSAGAEETRYAPHTCATGAVASANVAVDDTHVYWIEPDGRILRQPFDSTTTEPFAQTVRTQVGGYPGCCWIAVDATYVYWSEGETILRKAKSGGDSIPIYTEAGGNIFDLRAGGDGTLYYRTGVRLPVVRPISGSYLATTVAIGVGAYTLSTTRVFWGDVGDLYQINSAQRSDLSDHRTHYTSDGAGRPRITSLTTDGTNLYWHERRGATAGGPIWRRSITGIALAVQLTPYRSDVNLLQTAGGWLFWTDYNNGIWQIATGASIVAPPAGDLEVTELHVTQSIQDNDQRVPLIGEKTTVVRVFGRGIADSNGPWTDVVARMQVSGDPTWYESGPISLPTGGSDPATLNGSFTFALAHAATAPGTRTVSVTISAFSGRPEANLANNTITRTLTFLPAQRITWHGFTYGNTNTTCPGGYAPDGYLPPYSNFVVHQRFTENAFPVAQLSIIPMPGNPERFFDNSGQCEAYLSAHTYLARHMAMLFPGGGQRAYVLQPDGTGHHGWCCSDLSANQVARGHDLRSEPGETMAHEMAHSYGRQHTHEDPTFPRPAPPNEGPMGPYLGFLLFSNTPTPRPQVILGQTDSTIHFGDIMSYIHPQWVSPYTYCLLARSISSATVNCPAGLDGIPSAAAESLPAIVSDSLDADTYLYVSGYLDSEDAMVLDPFEQVELIGNPVGPAGKSYTLTLENLLSGPLPSGTFTFDIDPLPSENPDNPLPEKQRRFGFYIPWNPATERIRIADNGNLLAERTVTTLVPKFTSLNFAPGGQVSGKQAISWVADDEDGDPLTFSIWYSPNNGQQWLPVDVLQRNSSTEVDFDALPGSQQALVRVLASDGVNTTVETSAPFIVPLHFPVVSADVSLDETGYLMAATGAAHDAEDGAIEDPNAYLWSSNWQGEVGRGVWLSASALEPGSHHLTLTVTDSDGSSATAEMDVLVAGQAELEATVISPDVAGVLNWQGVYEVTVGVPQGFADAPVRLKVGNVISPTLPDPPGVVGESFQILAQDATGNPLTGPFAAPLTLSAVYSPALHLGEIDAAQLAFFFLDEASGSWEMIPSTVNEGQNQVVASLDHLTRFALVARLSDAAVLDLYLPATSRE